MQKSDFDVLVSEEILGSLKKPLGVKIKDSAVKQELEKQLELARSALRAISALRKSGSVEGMC